MREVNCLKLLQKEQVLHKNSYMKRRILVAVTNDVSTDIRVDKVCNYLLENEYEVITYGRLLKMTIPVERKYLIKRTKHFFNDNFLFYAEFNIRLFFYLLSNRFDVILANDLDTLPACFFVSKIKRIKLVYDSHELFSEGPELQGRKFVQNFWRSLENFLLPRVKYAYTVSDSISDFYNEKYQNEMGVVRNIPELNRKMTNEQVEFPTQSKVILYQGVLNPGRGIKPTVQALHYLKDVDFVIIGYGKVEDELRDFVIKEGLVDRVHFLGRIPYEKLHNYTKKADVGIVLEEPLGKSFVYSLPNKLFDYIHGELPFISGNLPEITKIVCEHKVGEIVKDYKPKTIASAIETVLNNSEKRNTLIENQKKSKESLCWEKEKRKLDVYFL